MKKILCDFQDSKGGAPRSHLVHAKALSELGYKVIAVISRDSEASFFEGTDFKVYHLPKFMHVNVFQKIRLLKKYNDIIRSENIDLIYVNRVVQCQFLSILSDFIGVPILNARAGGSVSKREIKAIKRHNDKHYIVYSEENLETFKNAGFSKNQLSVIRNRIPAPTYKKVKEKIPEEELIITITGSIKEDTLQGLSFFFQTIEKVIEEVNYNLTINLAGENLIKKKENRKIFDQRFKKIQSKSPKSWDIKHLGWVDNITQLQNDSHICIGKGRSIIEPAMMGKISFVISESGNLYRCKEDSYEDLLFYNFSGRGEIFEREKSLNEFIQLLKGNATLYRKYLDESNTLELRFKKDYSSEYTASKLSEAIDEINNGTKKPLKSVLDFMRFLGDNILNKYLSKLKK